MPSLLLVILLFFDESGMGMELLLIEAAVLGGGVGFVNRVWSYVVYGVDEFDTVEGVLCRVLWEDMI